MEGKATPLPQAYYTWKSINEGLWLLGAAYNLSFVVVFIFGFKNSNKPLRSPYFVLIAYSTALRIVTSIERLGKTFWKAPYPQWYSNIYELWAIYSNQFHGIVSIALAANRATAFIVPLRQEDIWKCQNFICVLIFITAFPFLTHIWLINVINVYWISEEEFKNFESFLKDMIRTHKYVHFINLITPLIAFVLNIVAVKIYFSSKTIINQHHENIEAKLLCQSIFSTVTFFLWNFLTLAAYHMTPIILDIEANREYELRDQLLLIRNCIGEIGNLISITYFEGGLLMLMKFSKPLRDYYFRFYKIDYVLRKIKKENIVVMHPGNTNSLS